MKAIGLVELPNCTDAIQALDVMLKTADAHRPGECCRGDRSSGSCKTQSRRTRGGFHSDCKSARRNLEVDRGQQKKVSVESILDQ